MSMIQIDSCVIKPSAARLVLEVLLTLLLSVMVEVRTLKIINHRDCCLKCVCV